MDSIASKLARRAADAPAPGTKRARNGRIPVDFSLRPPLEVWGGIECAHNRVGDHEFDQLDRTGHATRQSDLDLFADLGISAIRYPILWERIAPDGLENAHWAWADERLGRLRDLHIQPIVGLIHHGNGPRHTNLLDPAFATGLADYARAVAARFPWVNSYTPVNEPLTTARFGGLYGHWYPHGHDALTFARLLLNQCRAIVLAMRAVREVNPDARLVQTEDVGKTFSSPRLAYQAKFENERRWLTFDLLCGHVNSGHPMWHYLRRLGIAESELEWFLHNPCPPNVLGVDHYVTSERFLDDRLHLYPAALHGGNGRHAYVDVEAVRVCVEGISGPAGVLHETWERYHLPVALTEAHINCTREEQLRWLQEAWESAQTLWRKGVDIRAVTAWAMLGAYDWDSLMTRHTGTYEPGAFDLSGLEPRPTAVAAMLRELAAGRHYNHPVLAVPGWWRHPKRLLYPPVHSHAHSPTAPVPHTREERARPLVITGAEGALGYAFVRLCDHRGLPYHLLSREQMDITDAAVVERVLSQLEPWAVVNTGGFPDVDNAEHEPEACYARNVHGPEVLATACARQGIALLSFSSAQVFDGSQDLPYVERDAPSPRNVYGRSQAAAETRVLQILPSALIVRTGLLFGPWDEHNSVTAALRTLAVGKPFVAPDDEVVSPTYIPDLVHACLDLLIDGERGLWHLANCGAISVANLARRAAARAGLDADGVTGCPLESFDLAAPRPLYSVLGSERGLLLPSLEVALDRYFHDCELPWGAGCDHQEPVQSPPWAILAEAEEQVA